MTERKFAVVVHTDGTGTDLEFMTETELKAWIMNEATGDGIGIYHPITNLYPESQNEAIALADYIVTETMNDQVELEHSGGGTVMVKEIK